MTDLFSYAGASEDPNAPSGQERGTLLTPPPSSRPHRTCPTGRIWRVQLDADEAPMRVRELPAAPGLLKLGIILRHAARATHPRLQAPARWWRDDDTTWIAGTERQGQLLEEWSGERPTWSYAVDAVAPLATALQRAHRQGLVHGHLAPWNVYLEGREQTFTAVDFGTWPVERLEAGPFCPPELCGPEDCRQATPSTDIHNLARLLVYFALSPEEALRKHPNFETIPAYAIPTLERALNPEAHRRPQTIDEFLSGLSFHRGPTKTAGRRGDRLVHGRVLAREAFEHPKRGPGIRLRLADADDATGVFVYRDQHPGMFESLRNIWEGAELNLIGPRFIEDSKGRSFLTASEQTVSVVQPHWPVSVSDVLKAQGCPQRVMVDVRDPGEFTHHLAFGNLVHGFLEDLTDDDGLSFEEAIAARLPDLRLDFLAAGVDDAKLSKLVDDGRRHFQNLQRITARRTHQASNRDRVGWSGEHAEATRYSSRYGLEGRTDLVVTDAEEGLQIVELKSGKPWHDHAGQVQSYALLWRALADANDLPTSGALLYSKTGRLKNVPLDGDGDRQALMEGRNGLVSLYRSQVDPHFDYDPPFYMDQPALCRENACRFRRDRCRAQTELLGLAPQADLKPKAWRGMEPDLVRRARRYHRHLTRLVEMERWADHAALGAIFQPDRLPTRVADGLAAVDLTLSPADDVGRDRARLMGSDLHIFTPGDRLLLHRGDVDTRHVIRATVIDVAHDELTLRLRAAQVTDELAGPGWIADTMPSRIGYRTAHQALYRILESRRADLLDLLLRPHLGEDDEERAPHSVEVDRTARQLLNDSQIEAVQQGLLEQPATLIQGPPGTGKTTVIAHLSFELARRDKSVLLSALTNTAVDTMLIKLLAAADDLGSPPPPFLRLGSSERSPLLADELRRRGLDVTHYFSDDLARQTPSLATLASRLNSTMVIATTAHSTLRHPAMRFFERERGKSPFDVALVDEASQLTEPMALAPISAAKRFVLVGDHRQLPPIVTSEQALSTFLVPQTRENETTFESAFPIAPSLVEAGLAGLDRSLFERLAAFVEPRMLTVQYRMNQAIMAFPARTFYDDRLQADPTVADHRLEPGDDSAPAALTTDSPVVFVDVDGEEKGRTNTDEARAVLEVAAHLAETSPDTTVGVLSPFRAQVHLLRRLKRQQDLPDAIDVDTVERFQGNERDVIIASVVKTDNPGEFLSNPRRLNVALTRARKKLIIFGRRSCLEQDPTFRLWLDSPQTTVVPWNATT